MQKPSNLHLVVILLEIFGEKHQVVVVTPNNIALLIMVVHNISKHLVRLLIRCKLRLETPRGCKTVLLWEPKIVEQRPQYVIAVAIVILMNNLFIKEDRNALLHSNQHNTIMQNAVHNTKDSTTTTTRLCNTNSKRSVVTFATSLGVTKFSYIRTCIYMEMQVN